MAVRAAAPVAARVGALPADLPVERVARWLVLAVGLDLLLTRFLVRMAIFIPKGEPWASLSAGLGRVGAVSDALVPIVGLLLLAVLLLRAGRDGDRVERLLVALVAGVAAMGLTLLAFPPPAIVLVALDGIVAAIGLVAAARIVTRPDQPALARAGLGALAASVALAALGRAMLLPVVAGAGEAAFVAGAALAGMAGLRQLPASRTAGLRWLAAGTAVTLVILVAAVRFPVTWGSLSIWSLGLTGVVPPVAVAIALGLATAGLPRLAGRDAALGAGAAIILLAGSGLAASGLLLASLLGLALVGGRTRALPGSRPTPPAPRRG